MPTAQPPRHARRSCDAHRPRPAVWRRVLGVLAVLGASLAVTTTAAAGPARGPGARGRATGVLATTSPADRPASAGAPARVLLALGDSLASGYQPADGTTPPPIDPATGFRDQGYPHSYPADLAHTLGLGLVDLACPGETITSMSATPAQPACGATYRAELGATSQLGAARAYLARHRGLVRLVTIDIGANDVDGCLSLAHVDLACLGRARTAVSTELPRILGALRSALAVDDPGAHVVAMNYYDPLLAVAYQPGGVKGDADAALSVLLADGFNTLLAGVYHHAGVPMADVAGAFHTGQVAPALTYDGHVLPADVAYICRWTWMCPPSGSARPADIHPDDAGYTVIARTFARLVGQ